MIILPHHGVSPKIDPTAYLAEGVVVIGDVIIGADSSLWPHTVLRGDVFHIRVGNRTNIQDLSVGHVTDGTWPLLIEDDVTVGHRVVLHGCHIQSRCLIGMGSIIMDGAVVGEEAMIGAGSLVTPGTVIPPRTLAVGSPAKVKRDLSPEEINFLSLSAANYVQTVRSYRSPCM